MGWELQEQRGANEPLKGVDFPLAWGLPEMDETDGGATESGRALSGTTIRRRGQTVVKLFSTKTHGVIDYAAGPLLFTLPRSLKWNRSATMLLTGAAVGSLLYSLLTRYELGVVKVLPMRAHLVLDGMSGALIALAPLFLPEEDETVTAGLVGIGLFELMAALTTETKSPEE